MRVSVLFVGLLLLGGCTATYHRSDLAETRAKLDRTRAVLIATPANASFGQKEYRSSGQMTAAAVRDAFVRSAASADIAPDCRDLACLRSLGSKSPQYCVVPEILRWEDRATEWSGIPDAMEIKLTVYDSSGDQPLSSVILTGFSKWATLGGDHPQELLPAPLRKYVPTLYP